MKTGKNKHILLGAGVNLASIASMVRSKNEHSDIIVVDASDMNQMKNLLEVENAKILRVDSIPYPLCEMKTMGVCKKDAYDRGVIPGKYKVKHQRRN